MNASTTPQYPSLREGEEYWVPTECIARTLERFTEGAVKKDQSKLNNLAYAARNGRRIKDLAAIADAAGVVWGNSLPPPDSDCPAAGGELYSRHLSPGEHLDLARGLSHAVEQVLGVDVDPWRQARKEEEERRARLDDADRAESRARLERELGATVLD